MKKLRQPATLTAFLALAAGILFAQRTAREEAADAGGVAPMWTNDARFARDVFTFARLKYMVDGRYGYGDSGDMRWSIDFPDCDLNFSFRLQQVTSVKVDPDPKIVSITEKELSNYPFIYVIEPGRMTLQEDELPVLRRYLENGGFAMFDDFWGQREWRNFTNEMRQLFPNREIVDLPPEHPIFHCVFDLKERPQVPHVDIGVASEYTGVTYRSMETREPHYRAILDDKGRIMVLICHNTDLGDGWEREGENEFYFREFSEKRAYPLGINIIFYAMTH
jgi:hypothetical protein